MISNLEKNIRNLERNKRILTMMQTILKKMKSAKSNKRLFELKQELDWLHNHMSKNKK